MSEPWNLAPEQSRQFREAQAAATRRRHIPDVAGQPESLCKANLAKPAKPWESPEVGDVAQTAGGRLYRHVARFEDVLGRPLEKAGPAIGFDSGYNLIYQDQHGRERKCYSTSWFSWCSKAVREGGHYRRAGEEAR